MESKKLKTSLDPVGILVVEEGENYVGRLLDASINDALIAHEQREVIRQLVDALNGCRVRLGIHMKHTEDLMGDVAAHNALKAAAPYIRED